MKYEAWGFQGAGTKTRQFPTLDEARLWAGQYTEYVIYERVKHGWTAIEHRGKRGEIVAGAMA